MSCAPPSSSALTCGDTGEPSLDPEPPGVLSLSPLPVSAMPWQFAAAPFLSWTAEAGQSVTAPAMPKLEYLCIPRIFLFLAML